MVCDMSIDKAEQLKRELTDKFVVVLSGVPELRRFTGYTGRVKTVNMSGRALVQFDSPVDVGWYDIEPDYLKVVDAPAPKAEASHAAKESAPAKPAAAPAAAKPAAATEGKKLSPLELARQQGAKKNEASAGTASAAAAAPAAGKKLSPLELARQQGAAKKGGAAPAAAPAPQAVAPAEPAPVEPPAAVNEAPAVPESPSAPPASGKKLSPLELARQQGAFKKKPK